MARITVEDCLNRIDNRFAIIHLAAKRVRQLRKGAEPMVVCKNKDIVTALREIAGGMVFPTPETVTKSLIPNLEDPSRIEPPESDQSEGQ